MRGGHVGGAGTHRLREQVRARVDPHVDAAQEMQKVIIKTIKPINGKDGYFRITPGTPEECERFMAFIEAYF